MGLLSDTDDPDSEPSSKRYFWSLYGGLGDGFRLRKAGGMQKHEVNVREAELRERVETHILEGSDVSTTMHACLFGVTVTLCLSRSITSHLCTESKLLQKSLGSLHDVLRSFLGQLRLDPASSAIKMYRPEVVTNIRPYLSSFEEIFRDVGLTKNIEEHTFCAVDVVANPAKIADSALKMCYDLYIWYCEMGICASALTLCKGTLKMKVGLTLHKLWIRRHEPDKAGEICDLCIAKSVERENSLQYKETMSTEDGFEPTISKIVLPLRGPADGEVTSNRLISEPQPPRKYPLEETFYEPVLATRAAAGHPIPDSREDLLGTGSTSGIGSLDEEETSPSFVASPRPTPGNLQPKEALRPSSGQVLTPSRGHKLQPSAFSAFSLLSGRTPNSVIHSPSAAGSVSGGVHQSLEVLTDKEIEGTLRRKSPSLVVSESAFASPLSGTNSPATLTPASVLMPHPALCLQSHRNGASVINANNVSCDNVGAKRDSNAEDVEMVDCVASTPESDQKEFRACSLEEMDTEQHIQESYRKTLADAAKNDESSQKAEAAEVMHEPVIHSWDFVYKGLEKRYGKQYYKGLRGDLLDDLISGPCMDSGSGTVTISRKDTLKSPSPRAAAAGKRGSIDSGVIAVPKVLTKNTVPNEGETGLPWLTKQVKNVFNFWGAVEEEKNDGKVSDVVSENVTNDVTRTSTVVSNEAGESEQKSVITQEQGPKPTRLLKVLSPTSKAVPQKFSTISEDLEIPPQKQNGVESMTAAINGNERKNKWSPDEIPKPAQSEKQANTYHMQRGISEHLYAPGHSLPPALHYDSPHYTNSHAGEAVGMYAANVSPIRIPTVGYSLNIWSENTQLESSDFLFSNSSDDVKFPEFPGEKTTEISSTFSKRGDTDVGMPVISNSAYKAPTVRDEARSTELTEPTKPSGQQFAVRPTALDQGSPVRPTNASRPASLHYSSTKGAPRVQYEGLSLSAGPTSIFEDWTCPYCKTFNEASRSCCKMCFKGKPEPSSCCRECPRCTFINPPDLGRCEVCDGDLSGASYV